MDIEKLKEKTLKLRAAIDALKAKALLQLNWI